MLSQNLDCFIEWLKKLTSEPDISFSSGILWPKSEERDLLMNLKQMMSMAPNSLQATSIVQARSVQLLSLSTPLD